MLSSPSVFGKGAASLDLGSVALSRGSLRCHKVGEGSTECVGTCLGTSGCVVICNGLPGLPKIWGAIRAQKASSDNGLGNNRLDGVS